MFNRYWRSYPWYIQLVQFIALLLVLVSFFVMGLTPVVLKAMKVSVEEITSIHADSSRNVINAAMWIQFFSSLGIFLLPALLFAYFTHPKPTQYLGLQKPGRRIHWFLCILLILSATPVLLYIASLMSQLELGGTMKETQEAYDNNVKAFLRMDTPVQLFFTFFVMAIMPGISEELFFRGLIMRFSARSSFSRYLPVTFSAIIFASMHGNIYGMFPIFLAGILLGIFYLFTGSLWCSIVAHIFYNGFQVLLIYFSDTDVSTQIVDNEVPLWTVITGMIIFIPSFIALWKNRTELPLNWASDYTEAELAEKDSD